MLIFPTNFPSKVINLKSFLKAAKYPSLNFIKAGNGKDSQDGARKGTHIILVLVSFYRKNNNCGFFHSKSERKPFYLAHKNTHGRIFWY
jgi:hypothetical protein